MRSRNIFEIKEKANDSQNSLMINARLGARIESNNFEQMYDSSLNNSSEKRDIQDFTDDAVKQK